ncbi:ATP-binding cassette domain-containing protein [Actinokineospora soli]|uniref:ATP-binding cassette domain-containing protein n=1 Tax=Actinokineospora soli TaxID=1048753 RepID=A0ABW2TKD5_9PSEU
MIRYVAWAAAASVAAELAGVGLMATAARLLLRAAEHPPLGALAVAIVLVRTLALGRGGLRYAERLTGHRAVLEHVADLRGRIFDAVAARPHLPPADALTRLVSDVDAVQDALLRCLVPGVTAAVVGLAAGAAAFLVDPGSGVVVVAGLAAVACVGLARVRATEGPALRARLAEQATDLLRGAPDLAAFGATRRFRDAAAATSARIAALDRRSDGLPSAAVAVIGAATALGAGVLSDRGLPVTAALVLGLLAVFDVALPAVTAARHWPEHRTALRRVREALTGAVPAPQHPKAATTGPLTGKVAVVGPSGSGKTTLLRAIAATTHPDHVRGVFPDDHVFTATLRDNVLLGTPATPDPTALAPWLADLPDGWDTELTATTLSGGQRARLLLARALTARPAVLLLDEPVEGLDPATADALLTDLLAHPGTVVVATHRLAALPAADEILVLHDGAVVQRGHHRDLVDQPGYYRDRWLSERALDELTRPASVAGPPPPP